MPRLSYRVERLELTMPGADGVCACFGVGSRDIRIYDGPDAKADSDRDERPTEPCEVCGNKRDMIKIVVVETPHRAAP